jgi:hypothetical protein
MVHLVLDMRNAHTLLPGSVLAVNISVMNPTSGTPLPYEMPG